MRDFDLGMVRMWNVSPEADRAQPSGLAACVQAASAKQEPMVVRVHHEDKAKGCAGIVNVPSLLPLWVANSAAFAGRIEGQGR